MLLRSFHASVMARISVSAARISRLSPTRDKWPGWHTCPNPDNAREVYRRWLAKDLPKLHPNHHPG